MLSRGKVATTATTTASKSNQTKHRRTSWHCGGPLLSLLLLLLLLILQFDQIMFVAGCPSDVCICKWKGGKQTVECGGQQLSTIPEGMDPGTQVLNFSGNSLQVLQSERFLRMDLLNLQKIYLSRNQLIRVHEKAFRGLSNLVELDLSDNSLQNVPTETFQDYTSLMRLSLSGNPIRELKTLAFRHLSFLTTLELSNCQVERIENEAFVGMDNLEWLRLDGNRISFIQGSHILPKSLHGISLQSNRWTCDCRLIDMHLWLLNYNTAQAEEPKCVDPPRLKGRVIKTLKRDEFACLPEVTPQSSYKEISEGRNISIMCMVRAIPEPHVLWLFNGQVMTNETLLDNLHMYFYIDESGGEEKRSEVFIYNVGAEDNGTFSCVGQNVAGTAFSNYTLRVIIKEPPVVNEVSFPQNYMNYIIASSSGAGVIFVVLLCTIVVKCKQKKPSKRKTGNGKGGGGGGGGGSTDNISSNDTGLMKCSSIISSDGRDSLVGVGLGGLGSAIGIGINHHGGSGRDGMTPSKIAKENGIIIGGQIKQNLIAAYPMQSMSAAAASSAAQQSMAGHHHHLLDNGSMQLNVSGSSSLGTPPPHMMSNGLLYCSPPSSVRNYQEKNPDLVNDAECGKNKMMKGSGSGGDSEYDGSSDCSGPCSIQGMPPPQQPPPPQSGQQQQQQPQPFDNYYHLATNQFGSQIIRANGGGQTTLAPVASTRFTAMSTLPRNIQLKAAATMHGLSIDGGGGGGGSGGGGGGGGGSGGNQHHVDVHLNPVCFLGQDGFAYDFSNGSSCNNNNNNALLSHHHLHMQQQQNHLNSPLQYAALQQHQLQQHHQQHQQQQQQQQNFYRTLPHNRAHKQQQFAASAANPGARYSLEAEFLHRSNTPTTTYDKYLPNVRFTAEGYPMHAVPIVQYPSPPEGYKGLATEYTIAATTAAAPDSINLSPSVEQQQQQQQQQQQTSICGGGSFQQWPPCLPGYHAQPIRYPSNLTGMPQSHHQHHQNQQQQQQQQQQAQHSVVNSPAMTGQTRADLQSQSKISQQPAEVPVTSSSHTQTNNNNNGNNNNNNNNNVIGSTEVKKRCVSAQTTIVSASPRDDATAAIPECDETITATAMETVAIGDQETSKLRHLTGPLADSPDEGYVGDSHESSDI